MLCATSDVCDLMNSLYLLSKKVLNYYHYGLQESAYQAALVWELKNQGIQFVEEQLFHQWYGNIQLDKTYKMDLVVGDNIIVELKTKEEILSEHRLQLFNYMRLVNMPYGVLINFGNKGIDIERYYFEKDTNSMILFDRFGQSVFIK